VPSVKAGYGTLIVPQWPSAYFWPFLHDSSSQFKSFVKGVFELPCIEGPLVGRSSCWKVPAGGKFTRHVPRSSVVAQDSEC